MTSENDVFGGHLTLPKYKIVDCGAFCEVIFFCISPKNLLGDFFYSLNVKISQSRVYRRLAALSCSFVIYQASFAYIENAFEQGVFQVKEING